MLILIVEDDMPTSRAIELMVKSHGHQVEVTYLGAEAVDLAKDYEFDIILLDLNLPDISGYQVLETIRSRKIATPVLILSALNGIEDKVKALDKGADDYVTKPFHKDELISRINAVVRHSRGKSQSLVRLGGLEIELVERCVTFDGQPVHLTENEKRIMEALAIRSGSVITKGRLMQQVYGGRDEPELKIIDVFICKIRKKLAMASGGQQFIETVWGVGWKLTEPSRCPPTPKYKPPGSGDLADRRALVDAEVA